MRSLALILPIFLNLDAPAVAQAAHRDRIKSCNADTGSQKLAGSARKGFMSDCLGITWPTA